MPVQDFAVFVFVASVPRSIEFYERFGFKVEGQLRQDGCELEL